MTSDVVSEIAVRFCEGTQELRACLDLQKSIWNYSDADVVPSPILIVAQKTGGHVLGAFDDGRLVGFTVAFAGQKNGRPYLHSHFLGVLPDYRNRGVGRALKLAQRDLCLRDEITLIEWTFDPLAVKNAWLNISRLGGIVREIIPNLYGITSSHLHGGLPTDRLIVQWHLNSERVKSALAGRRPPCHTDPIRVSLPANISELRLQQPAQVGILQTKIRQQFEQYFSSGYAVTGFEIEGATANYLLEPYEN